MAALSQWLDSLPAWLTAFIVVVLLSALAVLSGLIFEKVVVAAVRRLARKTKTEVDDLILRAVHPAVAVLVVILVLHAGLHSLHRYLPPGTLDGWSQLVLAMGILVGAILAARIVGGLLQHATKTRARWRPVGRLGTRIANVVVYLMAFMVILGSYGISITPIITSLGIAGLAVALALQDTLSNFFAGVWIQSGQSIQAGHYVKLEGEKIEGYIDDVGWRTTKIRQLGNNITVVPNSKMAQAIVTDYHLPETRMSLLVPVSVGYECDPRHVERVLVEVASKAAGEVEGLLAEPKPFVRFIPGFGDFSLNFTLICQVREYVDQYLAQHELRMRILDRFRAEGIRIPYPTRETYMVPPDRPDVAPPAPNPAVPGP